MTCARRLFRVFFWGYPARLIAGTALALVPGQEVTAMFEILPALAPIPDPTSFGSAFVSDLSFAFAAWLVVPVIVHVVLIALALRRDEPEPTETVHEPATLRAAA
jgi:hypothetical protein